MIPQKPLCLRLPICRLWNGTCLEKTQISAVAELSQQEDGMKISFFIHLDNQMNLEETAQKIGSLFLVEKGGQYLRFQIDHSGSYELMGFDKNHEMIIDLHDKILSFFTKKTSENFYETSFLIPWEVFPKDLFSLNAFFQYGEQMFAYHPISLNNTNLFQQIETFPLARLA
jgi:hypothetical protein